MAQLYCLWSTTARGVIDQQPLLIHACTDSEEALNYAKGYDPKGERTRQQVIEIPALAGLFRDHNEPPPRVCEYCGVELINGLCPETVEYQNWLMNQGVTG